MNGDKDSNWIDELRLQFNSLFSNTILVETTDKKRNEELCQKKPKIMNIKGAKRKENWIYLDGWEGFYYWKKNDKGELEQKQFKNGSVSKYGINEALPTVSDELYKGNRILVVSNIFKSNDHFNNAIRGWSNSDTLRDRDTKIVIFADDRSMFPPEVWTHMKIIKPPKSTWKEREKTIRFQQDELNPTTKIGDKKITDVVRLTAGMNLDQLESAVIKSIIIENEIKLSVLSKEKNELFAKNPVIDLIDQPKFGFEGVGGYQSLKNRIRDDVILPLRHPEFAKRYCMKSPRGILLYGPPGTGKTLLVKSMAKELNMSILLLRPENILGKYVGESEKSMRKVFEIAEAMVPCIVFIDELDRFSKRSGGDNVSSHVERELFSMLLEKLGDENREWFFAGATNNIDAIDPALRRTGRIDSVAPVPFPDEEARMEIFKIHTTVKRKLPLKNDIDIERIVKETYMWSGSDIEQLVIRTSRDVMKSDIKDKKHDLKIGMDDFLRILNTFNIPVDKNEGLQSNVKDKVMEYTNDKRLMHVFEHAQDSHVSKSKTEKAKNITKGLGKKKTIWDDKNE